ncbi:hypothetical protein VULLAG_LOCUS17030 [Vulpes lagopus]
MGLECVRVKQPLQRENTPTHQRTPTRKGKKREHQMKLRFIPKLRMQEARETPRKTPEMRKLRLRSPGSQVLSPVHLAPGAAGTQYLMLVADAASHPDFLGWGAQPSWRITLG